MTVKEIMDEALESAGKGVFVITLPFKELMKRETELTKDRAWYSQFLDYSTFEASFYMCGVKYRAELGDWDDHVHSLRAAGIVS